MKKSLIISLSIGFILLAALFLALNSYLSWWVDTGFLDMLIELLPIYLASIVIILVGIFFVIFLMYTKSRQIKPLVKEKIDIKEQPIDISKITMQEKTVLDYFTCGLVVLKTPATVLLINKEGAKIVGYRQDKDLFYFMADTEFYNIIEAREDAEVHRIIDNKTFSFMFNFDGENIIVLIEDVTRLRAAENIKNEFIANITHEMSTPLTSIVGYADLIKQGMNEENTKNAADTIAQQSIRLGSLIKGILNYSQIDADEIKNHKVDLSKTLKESIFNLSSYMQEKNIKIDTIIDEDVMVNSRHEHALDFVNNLLINAVKYNIEGGNIAVSLTKEPKMLTIEDSGIGIAPDNIEKSFNRFYTLSYDKTDIGQNSSGYGLGLAIVKKIALKNNWKIKVESTLNKGTKFIVNF